MILKVVKMHDLQELVMLTIHSPAVWITSDEELPMDKAVPIASNLYGMGLMMFGTKDVEVIQVYAECKEHVHNAFVLMDPEAVDDFIEYMQGGKEEQPLDDLPDDVLNQILTKIFNEGKHQA